MTLVLDHVDPTVDAAPADQTHAAGRGALSIGLVNNMPDGALRATERQFIHLLRAASGGGCGTAARQATGRAWPRTRPCWRSTGSSGTGYRPSAAAC